MHRFLVYQYAPEGKEAIAWALERGANIYWEFKVPVRTPGGAIRYATMMYLDDALAVQFRLTFSESVYSQ